MLAHGTPVNCAIVAARYPFGETQRFESSAADTERGV